MRQMSKKANLSLAPVGEKTYEWAHLHMPALVNTIEAQSKKQPLKGKTVAVCLHVTKETSVLVMGLRKLGAEVHLASANPLSTQDEIAAYLASKGIVVQAWRNETNDEYFECIRHILRSNPDIVMDDGADAHVTIHEEKEFYSLKPLGGTEETTTGVVRLGALDAAGKLRYPIIAVNNAYTKHLFDNRYGTGQSTMDGILRATSLLIAGKRVVVCGYGWVGKGVARRARGFDARVIVTEVDPLKALEAHSDGFEVLTMTEAAKVGDLFITATGQTGIIRLQHMLSMGDGAILANAGHFDVEVDVKSLQANSVSKREIRPHVEEFVLKNRKRIFLIAQGRIANLVAAEGHPPEVMMMSFSNQLLSTVYVAKNGSKMERKLHNVPEEIDRQVAKNTLDALRIKIDEPTEEQVHYAKSWM